MFGKKNSEHELYTRRIKDCSIFETLSDSEIKALLKISHVRDYSAGERVFAEGTVGLCFYIIVKGSVDMVMLDSPEQMPVRNFTDGDIFSEIHLFSETNHSVTCVSKDLTKLLVFTKPDIEDLININPKLGNRILLRFLDFLGRRLEEVYRENKELRLLKTN